MTNSGIPWKGLGFDQARRVDRNGKRDFFWAVVKNEAPALVLDIGTETKPVYPLPKIRSLDIRYGNIGASPALVVSLKDVEQIDLFATLCRDVVLAGEEGVDTPDALNRSIRRTLRWHHLLRGGTSDRLSIEEQRGLVGELQMLGLLCNRTGLRAAIESWKGPEGAAKVFELFQMCIEVKARRGAARPYVQISSEDQLADVDGAGVFLRVYEVDAAIRLEGHTLTDHVKLIDEVFKVGDLEAYQMWETALAAVGFDWDHDYSDRRWSVGKIATFLVEGEFPRLPTPVPNGVINVKYAVSLEACQPFVVAENDFEAKLTVEYV